MNTKAEPVLDQTAIEEMPAFAEVMPRVAAEYGKSLPGQLSDMLTYCLRGNRLSVDEYYNLCLFDDKAWSVEEKKRVIGVRKNLAICTHFNRSNPWSTVVDDKLAFEKMLAGFGYRTTRTLAVFGGRYPDGETRRLDDEAGLADFLAVAAFPIFGKPSDSARSMGAVRITGFDRASGTISLAGGRIVELSDFVAEIRDKFGGVYLFQECIEAHPDLAAICGGGLPTVRFVTLDRGEGPEIFRIAVKLTGGGNVADNFWRKGNLIAPIDAGTGLMGKAATSMGINGERVSHHPDTGAAIEGVALPYFEQARDLALDAARLLEGSLLLGFDIAIDANGPLIIEANPTPHLVMMEVSHGKGILDEHMIAAMAYLNRIVDERKQRLKEQVRADRKKNKQDVMAALHSGQGKNKAA